MVRATGGYCIVDGREYRDGGATSDYVLVRVPADRLDQFRSEMALTRDADARPPWVKVATRAVKRRYFVTVEARWRGVLVTVDKLEGDRAVVTTFDKTLAEQHGWPGSQHDLWSGWVPVAELTDVVEKHQELPLRYER